MQISVLEDAGSTATVSLKGRLDLAGSDAIALPLAKLSRSKSGLLIDMSGVTYIGSSGIRQFVSASKALMSVRLLRMMSMRPSLWLFGLREAGDSRAQCARITLAVRQRENFLSCLLTRVTRHLAHTKLPIEDGGRLNSSLR